MLNRMKHYLQTLQLLTTEVDYSELAEALRKGMDQSSIYVLGRRGKVLGYALEEGFDSTPFDSEWLSDGYASSDIQGMANRVADVSVLKGPNGEDVMVTPIIGADERVGSILCVRRTGKFEEEDLDIAQIAGVTIGMIISRVIFDRQEDEANEARAARSAINSLSYSEILAMQRIFEELDGDEEDLITDASDSGEDDDGDDLDVEDAVEGDDEDDALLDADDDLDEEDLEDVVDADLDLDDDEKDR